MKSFNSLPDLIDYGKNIHRTTFEKVNFQGKNILISSTNQIYEDKISEISEESLQKIADFFGIDGNIDSDCISELRDSIRNIFEKNFNTEFLSSYTEY